MIRVTANINFRLSIILFSLFALFIPKSLEERTVINASSLTSIPIDTTLLCEGDIIFRRGISFVSNLVLENDSESPYSHVGIVTFDKDKPFVIHAVPEESENYIDYIKKDPIQIFLQTDRASAYSVTRCIDKTAALKAAEFSEKVFKAKIIFDDSFSLIDTSKFYCTELVWQAFKHSGVDLTDNKFDTLLIPIGQSPYLLPGTLLNSPHTIQVTKTSIFQ